MTAAVPPRAAAGNDAFWLVGKATVRRLRRWKFPVFELEQDGEVLAQMGRTGWIKVYLGTGQRVELPNGDRWTIRSIGIGGTFSPIIVDSSGRKVALAGMSHGTYGINGKDYSCVLAPVDEPMIGRANTWKLNRFEDDLATITRYPLGVDASLPGTSWRRADVLRARAVWPSGGVDAPYPIVPLVTESATRRLVPRRSAEATHHSVRGQRVANFDLIGRVAHRESCGKLNR